MSEYQLPNGWLERLRGAQRDLIKAAGGIERVAELLGRSVGHVGRWNNPALDDLMPLSVIILLEQDTKAVVFSKLLPQMIHDRELTEPKGDGLDTGDVMEKGAEVAEAGGAFMGDLIRAASDGSMTDAELIASDRKAAEVERKAAEYREMVARRRSRLRLVREG